MELEDEFRMALQIEADRYNKVRCTRFFCFWCNTVMDKNFVRIGLNSTIQRYVITLQAKE